MAEITRPTTIGDLLDDRSLWPKGVRVRIANVILNQYTIYQHNRRIAAGASDDQVWAPVSLHDLSLDEFARLWDKSAMRRWKEWGAVSQRCLDKVLAQHGVVLRDRLASPVKNDRVPLTRDVLLAAIARSLQATHPDDAATMIAEVEKRLADDHALNLLQMARDLAGTMAMSEQEASDAIARSLPDPAE